MSLLLGSDAERDRAVVQMWLDCQRSASTVAAYRREAIRLRVFLGGAPLRMVTPGQLEAYRDSLRPCALSSQGARFGAVKSLFGYAHRLGYLPSNPGTGIRAATAPTTRGRRFRELALLEEMVRFEPLLRNRVILKCALALGLGLGEIEGLRWEHFREDEAGGQVQVDIGGRRERWVAVAGAALWGEFQQLRGRRLDGPVFLSRQSRGSALTRTALHRISKRAGRRVGLDDVSLAHLRANHIAWAHRFGVPLEAICESVGLGNVRSVDRYLVRPVGGGSSAAFAGL